MGVKTRSRDEVAAALGAVTTEAGTNLLALTESTPIELCFLTRLRTEQRFPSAEELKAQIAKDVEHARRVFRSLPTARPLVR